MYVAVNSVDSMEEKQLKLSTLKIMKYFVRTIEYLRYIFKWLREQTTY